MNILVTTGSWNASLTVMESLAKGGHDIYLLDSDPYCAGFQSRYCKEGILCPLESSGIEYVEAVKELVRSRRFDFLIPISDLSTEFLSLYRERILPYVPMLLPSKELIELARCKDKTYQFAIENNILIPKTYFPASLEDIRGLADQIVFPCVVKKSKGTANKGNAYIDSKEKLLEYYKKVDHSNSWPVIQEFIKGNFYGFLGVVNKGEIIDGFMYKTDQKYALGGTAPYCCSVKDEIFLNTIKKVLKSFNWSGAINIDFLQDEEGQWRLLEINPRLSGSLTFAYKLGVDLPYRYLALGQGEKIKTLEQFAYKGNVMFRYVLPLEIIFAFKNKKYLLNLFCNFFNFRMKTDIPWRDPKLLVWKLKHLRWYWQDGAQGQE